MNASTPNPTMGPHAEFLAHLREGRLMIQRSRSSGQHVFYPRSIAPVSGADDLEFVPISGDGVVYSTTVVRQPAKFGGDYNISLVQLAEGPRMLTRVLGGAPEQVHIGMKVTAHIEAVDFGNYAKSDQPLVVFRALPSAV